MLRLVLYFSATLFALPAMCQLYFGYGYGANFASVKGLNQFVDNYNDTRTWLDKEMKHFGYVDGLVINFGAGIGPGWFDFEYGFRGQKRDARGTGSSGVEATRELKLQQHAFAISTGYIAAESNGGVAFGMRAEFGSQNIKTRIYETGTSKGDWAKIDDNLMANVGPVMKIFIAPGQAVVTSIAIYYTFGLLNSNSYSVEEEINSFTASSSTESMFENKNNVFGINIVYGIFGS